MNSYLLRLLAHEFWLAEREGDVTIPNHVLQQILIMFAGTTFNVISCITLICLFIVMTKRVMKYMTRMGQKTGMLKNSKKVQPKPMSVAFVAEYQNLNSGSRRMNGRNSSFCLVGSASPSSAESVHIFLSLEQLCVSLTYRLLLRALPSPGLSWA